MNPNSIMAMAAAIAVFTGVGAGIGTALATGKAVESVARQPEAKGDIMSTMILGIAFAEVTSLYALIISIILIFTKWQ